MLLQMVPLFWTELWRLVNGCGSNKIFIQVMMSLSRAGTILPGEGCVDCMPHAVLCCLRTESREHNVRENGLKQFKLSPQSLHQCGPLLCSWVCWMPWSGSTPLHIVKWPADRRCSGAPSAGISGVPAVWPSVSARVPGVCHRWASQSRRGMWCWLRFLVHEAF